MKIIYTLSTAALLLLSTTALHAQGTEIAGYANLWFQLTATNDGGKVCASPDGKSVKLWRQQTDFRQSLPVADFAGVTVYMFYMYAQPAEGYSFGGWYEDDGDGVFNMEKDGLLSFDEEYLTMGALPEGATVYTSQQEAAAGAFPDKPQVLFAYFTRGLTVGMSYYQDENFANCGSVWIDKQVNEPGDQVTLRALPNDGFHFVYWQDAKSMGNVVSLENPLTTTVQGGEHLYAYFAADDAPVVELPADGGYKVINTGNTPWVLSDESMRAGAHVIVLATEDMVKDTEGRTFLDASKEDAHLDVSQINGAPTIVSGKGTVSFAYKLGYGIAREHDALVKWSGDKGVEVKQDVTYVYAFDERLGAFIQVGNTDTMTNPDAPASVKVAPQLAYMAVSAFDMLDMLDTEGRMPTIFGLSPDSFDRAVTGIDGVRMDTRTLRGRQVYTLGGVRVQGTDRPGIYIINGKKTAVK